MNRKTGNLNQISLAELLRGCALQQRTGTLTLCREGLCKRLYFNHGHLIYLTSNKGGERVGEYLVQRGDLTTAWAGFLLQDSKRNGLTFTDSLLKKNIFDRQQLQLALSQLATAALADALSWTQGTFEFADQLPREALEGPIRISEEDALKQILAGANPATSDDELLRQLAQRIVSSGLNLPLLPVSVERLDLLWQQPQPATELFELVHNDAILTASLLRVVNSGIGPEHGQAATLAQARTLYSSDYLLGILHAKAATASRPRQPETVLQLLQHGLRCACLSQQIAAQLGGDDQLAYTCGLLHNLGKVLLLELLDSADRSSGETARLVQKFHQNAGALLARRWNLAPQLHSVIRHYQHPAEAREFQPLVETVFLSHSLLTNPDSWEQSQRQCHYLDLKRLQWPALRDNLPLIDELVAAAFGPPATPASLTSP